LPDWCASINGQECQDFDVWIGVDGIDTDMASKLISPNFHVNFFAATDKDTPSSLRSSILMMITSDYDLVILTDVDDVLEPSRVSAALQGIVESDLHGCALGLIELNGRDLGIYFGLNDDEDPYAIVPYNNFLGFSNTIWRTEILRKCLPIPKKCIALDWLLATRAWSNGARITFDRTIRMRYRQYGTNIARVVPPFSAVQIIRATAVVTDHYKMVTNDPGIPAPQRQTLREAAARIGKFRDTIMSSEAVLDTYVTELNKLPPHRLWWMSVAHPALEGLWNC